MSEPNEAADADYLKRAIADGHAHQIMDDIRTLDAILSQLGLSDSDDDPVAAIRELLRR